ncbi:MAG: Methionine synthase [Candidatus Celerinatantimonas neptuna]|nr:MAG: Methionine synthase [Candidatus Celerinatantimonas neptuna]
MGGQARQLYSDANQMLDRFEQSQELTARGIVGMFAANRVGDDIEIYVDESCEHVSEVSHQLRQRTKKTKGANYFYRT